MGPGESQEKAPIMTERSIHSVSRFQEDYHDAVTLTLSVSACAFIQSYVQTYRKEVTRTLAWRRHVVNNNIIFLLQVLSLLGVVQRSWWAMARLNAWESETQGRGRDP